MEKRVALVTGGSRGIGRAIAEKFAKNGYNLVINYVSDNTNLDEIKEGFSKYGVEVLLEKADVSNFNECEKMVTSAIEKFGKIDTLVNNAGITRDNLVMKMNDEEFDAVYETNLKGVFHTIHHTSRYFLKQKSGRIINISSVSGITGNAGQANYCAAKAGVIGLTKSVARELSSRGITANVVAPGMIETDMTKDLPDTVKENMFHNIPLGRIGKPEEIAAAVAFLASEEAGYITGQVLAVDGGMTM